MAVRSRVLMTLCGSAITISVAMAQEASRSPASSATGNAHPLSASADIVVTGRSEAVRRRAAHAFVRAVSGTPVDGQFARWQAPLCPSISGLDAALADRLLVRLRATAASVGAPVAPPPCRTNAVVVFTPDAHGLIDIMQRRDPRLLRDVPLPDRRLLRTAPLPVRWWYGTHSEGADGNQLQDMPSAAFGAGGTGGPSNSVNDRTRFGDGYRSSMISTGLRVGIDHVTVLVDVPLTTGRRLDAVMDYAAFVILGRVRLAPPTGSLPTVLRLFDAAAASPPDRLTESDRRYLASLYAIPADRPARTQASLMAGGIARSAGMPAPD